MKCSVCGATGVKLWREYNTFEPKLFCVRHAQGKEDTLLRLDRSTMIGNLVPAVSDGHGDYWGFDAIPDTEMRMWRMLPDR